MLGSVMRSGDLIQRADVKVELGYYVSMDGLLVSFPGPYYLFGRGCIAYVLTCM
ncbi:hypothetical protein Acr_23g0000560 [Actinidia rufa]|uniref:Uncharacterized protein n=1 Tax=Actinidia rufa TaxID=165716 RepID=A0A7J0GLP5_9ERIC|nr:hypothetical protein Acr_23g0000560 [Actinidia rufa]